MSKDCCDTNANFEGLSADYKRRLDLPSAIQPVICQSLEEVIALFHL
jgi:hypothetical protein